MPSLADDEIVNIFVRLRSFREINQNLEVLLSSDVTSVSNNKFASCDGVTRNKLTLLSLLLKLCDSCYVDPVRIDVKFVLWDTLSFEIVLHVSRNCSDPWGMSTHQHLQLQYEPG